MQFCTFKLAGNAVTGAKVNEDKYYISQRSLEKLLGWSVDTTRKKIASKSLKAFAGKVKPLGKISKPNGGYIAAIDTKDASIVITWEATRGNKQAQALAVALINETIERRIDNELNLFVSEQKREDKTADLYNQLREEFRINYIPQLKHWFRADGHSEDIMGSIVNQWKRSLGLPVRLINTYSLAELRRYRKDIINYSKAREQGLDDFTSIKKIQAMHLTLDKPRVMLKL